MSAVFEPRARGTVPVIWYVMAPGASSPVGLAAEPGEAGVDIPVDIWEWAQANGVDADNNPDVYMLVTTEPNPGRITGALAARDGEVSAGDATRIDESRAQAEDWHARSGLAEKVASGATNGIQIASRRSVSLEPPPF